MKYTIERLNDAEDFTQDMQLFMEEEFPKISAMFDHKVNYKNVRPLRFAKEGFFLIGRRDGEIRGFMIAVLGQSPFDHETKILKQISLYVKPDSGRTAYHLFKKFIDIGKAEANHIITMLTSKTNIKPETLKKLGFKELEVLYRLEV